MTLLALSINHRTAGMDVLARASMDSEASAALARQLVAQAHVGGALVLSTCNRTEVYLDTSRFHAGLESLVDPLAGRVGVDRSELPDLCTVYYDDQAVQHCFSLVSGLDSLVVGENQILGQVREALSQTQRQHTSGPAINELFQTALRVGKRVQSETAIGSAGRSVLSAALEQLEMHGISVDQTRCLVVGAGQMAGLAARSLATRAARVDCANRTFAKAERLAAEVGGNAIGLECLAEVAGHYDILVTCTGAAGGLLNAATLGDGPVPRAILDLALPPDVDPDVVTRGVHLVNLAALAESADENLADQVVAQALVDGEVASFLAKQRAAAVTPTVVALRRMAERVVSDELARIDRRLPDADQATRAEVAQALHRVAEKLIHQPTVRVREFATQETQPVDYAAALRSLFSLDPQKVASADPAECPVLQAPCPQNEDAATESAQVVR